MALIYDGPVRPTADSAADWTSIDPVLKAAEIGVETDTLKVKIGDGVTAWTGLPYASEPPTASSRAIAALIPTADQFPYFTSTSAAALATVTSYARTLLESVDEVDAWLALDLGTAAVADIGTSGATIPLLNGTNTWGGTQTFGTLGFGDGSAASPTLRFSADTDTGFFRAASNTVSITQSGVEAYRFSFDRITSYGSGVNNAQKNNILALSAYVNPQNPLCLIFGQANSATNILRMGGGSGSVQAPTLIELYTASAVNSVGTVRWSVNNVGHFLPGADNSYNVGSAGLRVGTYYGATGTINTSDEREKVWRGAMSEQEAAAASAIVDELGFYQWTQSVEEKGPDGARLHFGVRAQRAFAIMEQHGLDWRRYAWCCHDAWKGGDRYGIRTDQLALFLIAAVLRR